MLTFFLNLNFKFNFKEFLYYIFYCSIITGLLFSIGQFLGFNLGQYAGTNKIRFLIMLFNYTFVHLSVLSIMTYRTFNKKINKDWIFISIYFLTYIAILFCLNFNFREIFFLYLRLIGIFFFIFLHSVNISDKSILKLLPLIFKAFKLVVIVSIVHILFLKMGHTSVVFHPPRINSIFSDYNDLASYFLTLIPTLWFFKKNKSIAIAIILIILSNSATILMVLILFLFFMILKQMKRKKYLIKTTISIIVTTISFLLFLFLIPLSHVNVHTTNSFLKIRQLIHLLSIENLILIKNSLNNNLNLSYHTSIFEGSSTFIRVKQFLTAVFGWENHFELLFGVRTGLVEGLYLSILIKFGFIGFLVFTFYYWKYYVRKTDSKVWRLYFVALYIGAGFALPIFSFSISMFIVSIQLYVFQRLLIMKNSSFIYFKNNKLYLKANTSGSIAAIRYS